MSAIRYRPEIDGLRAVAVIPVVLFHLGLSWIAGGFTGVDVFFVISGFLITSIILKEQSAGTFTFRDFWMRRVRRILPAMLTVLAATSVAGYFILYGPQWQDLGKQVLSVIFLCANMLMWKLTGNYWGTAAEEAPLLHCWSLSVEEQFYLFYPLALILTIRYAKKYLLLLLGGVTVLSFLLCLVGTERSPSATFYLLPTRAWELAAGCMLAIFMFRQREESASATTFHRFASLLAGLGIVLIALGYLVIRDTGFPGWQALLPVVGSVLVIQHAGSKSCFVTQFLSHPAMIYVGKISYSLYLWHWPIIVLGNALSIRYPEWIITVGVWILIPLLSMLSYHFVEKRARYAKRVVPSIMVGTVACVAAAIALLNVNYTYDFSSFEKTETFGAKYDLAPLASAGGGLLGVTGVPRGSQQNELYAGDGIRNRPDLPPQVVVFGSSHGLMWAQTIEDLCNELDISVSLFTVRAVPPLVHVPPQSKASNIFTLEQKKTFDENRLAKLKEWKPRLLILSDRWSARSEPGEYESLVSLADSIGCHVLFIEQPPEVAIGSASGPMFAAIQKQLGSKTPDVVRCENQKLVDAAAKNLIRWCATQDNCSVLPTQDLYSAGNDQVRLMAGSQVLYIDEDHLSQAGATLAKGRLRSAIETLVETKP